MIACLPACLTDCRDCSGPKAFRNKLSELALALAMIAVNMSYSFPRNLFCTWPAGSDQLGVAGWAGHGTESSPGCFVLLIRATYISIKMSLPGPEIRENPKSNRLCLFPISPTVIFRANFLFSLPFRRKVSGTAVYI